MIPPSTPFSFGNIQELVEGDVTELTSRGAEVQVTLLWAALLGTKLQKPT